ncbi:hypothetical protein DK2_00001 [Bacillus phage DK2]|uniref:Uncharacterized protein n=1 Tax=Bacillus phage DK2 TaxID=2500809 RepID=A0A3T0IJ16_9CAUD|nr:hypothetical protein H3017_gp01 [Bacillus phage DK2]AZU99754.1 hypothetical protein DK2_00001 [Bacillus phage DK2]
MSRMENQFTNTIKDDLKNEKVIYCGIASENSETYYVGLDNDLNIIFKSKVITRENKNNKHNEIGNRKQPMKKFCENNNKIYISNIIVLVEDKIRNLDFFLRKFKGL